MSGRLRTFIPLVRDGLFPDRAPISNVEGGCATGSLALAGAYKEVKAGDADLVLEAPLHVEVKRTERLSPYQFIDQAKRDCKPASGRAPIVLMRSNNRPWLVMMEASDWVRVSEILLHARVQGTCRVPEAL